MNNPFDTVTSRLPFNSFMPQAYSRRWVEQKRLRYQNPEKYKEYLKQQSDERWKQAISGGVSEEMSEKEAIRKREEQKKKQAEEEEILKRL